MLAGFGTTRSNVFVEYVLNVMLFCVDFLLVVVVAAFVDASSLWMRVRCGCELVVHVS